MKLILQKGEITKNINEKEHLGNLNTDIYDTIILGGGPAGLGAGLYASRYGLKSLLISKELGGEIKDASIVENYLGFPSISGPDLVAKFVEHVKQQELKIVEGTEITSLTREGNLFIVKTDSGLEVKGKTVIIATGRRKRKLGLDNEDIFLGKGISYCFTCDGPLFKDKIVAVVGGSDSAVLAALYLAKISRKVYLLVRSKIRAQQANYKLLKPYIDSEKVEVIMPITIKKLIGKNKLEAIELSNGSILMIDGLFVEIGGIPNIDFINIPDLNIDKKGYIVVDKNMSTNIPGLFAAGDIINHPLKQCITSAAEGAIAAHSCYNYLK